MKRLLLITALAIVLMPSPAEARPASAAGCACWTWANGFKNDADAQKAFDRQVTFSIRGKRAKKVKEGVYDYAKTGEFRDSFCKRNTKICKAIIACVAAGGGAYVTARAAGQSKKTSRELGAINCANAATTVLVIP